MSRKQPKRRILVKQLLRHGQVWFIRRYGYTAWKNVALNLNDRKDIRLGWALTDRSYEYVTKMRMFYGQFRVHEAMGDTIIAEGMLESLRDVSEEYEKYRLNRYDCIERLLKKYDRRRRYGWK